MGIVLPETCWACNKICNKYHLLHLVGILFPHKNLIKSLIELCLTTYCLYLSWLSSSHLGFKLLFSRILELHRQELRRERWILKHSLGWERREIICRTLHSVWKWCRFTYRSKEFAGTPCRISALENQSVRLTLGKEYAVRNVWGESGCKSRSRKSGEEVKFCSTLASDRTGPSTAVTSHSSSLCASFVVNLVLNCFALHSISSC